MSRDLARVVELTCKAFELQEKGHYARASEKGAAAIAAAQELAQEDCLVVAQLQLMNRSMLRGYEQTPGVAAETASAAKEQGFELLLAAFATLERRKAAGTLLAGTCRSWPEEEWYGHFLQKRMMLTNVPVYAPEELALLVQFVGYDAYMSAAAHAVHVLNAGLMSPSFDSLALARYARYVVCAIDLFEQPRHIWRTATLASEGVLAGTLYKTSETIEKHNLHNLLPAPFLEVLGRWQHFTRSGVLQERDIVAGVAHCESVSSARKATCEAGLAATSLKCCSLQSCSARELHPGHYKRCSACHTVVYCSRDHQLEDWPAHKAACKAARKAAAAEGGGAD